MKSMSPYNKMLATKIPRHLDRRVKITDEIKQRVKDLANFDLNRKEIANECGISVSSVRYILFPNFYEYVKNASKNLKKTGRYKPTSEEKAQEIRNYRHYKKLVLITKKI